MLDGLRPLLARFMFGRYLLVSVCALCADMALFLTLSQAGQSPLVAAAGGYIAGLALHWLLSVRFVFPTEGGPTHFQRLAFIASAFLGLGITVAMVTGLCALGMAPAAAKSLAIPISFLCVYAVRKHGIFASA
ncbi:GtrA family protein [Sphingobium bisphenolivorans]|uniref:GtrA family protein n=1 Tax=Sphingobium bisphenolivorans TaxID=1335760 RepID=UPI00039E15FF|nr:GtrA family protein [Sphingobium bisphenolivorans]